MWLKCHDWFVNYSRTLEYLPWKPGRCADKDERETAFNKGHALLQGTGLKMSRDCFSPPHPQLFVFLRATKIGFS